MRLLPPPLTVAACGRRPLGAPEPRSAAPADAGALSVSGGSDRRRHWSVRWRCGFRPHLPTFGPVPSTGS